MRFTALLTSVLFCTGLLAAPDEAILGKDEGYPACRLPGLSQQRCLVWMYSHLDEVVSARKVVRGDAVRELKRAAAEPEGVDFNAFLANNRNTGLLLLKGDTVLLERYQYDRKPEQRFTSMSMAKTVVSMLIGIAVPGVNYPERRIDSLDLLPELSCCLTNLLPVGLADGGGTWRGESAWEHARN